MRKFLLNNVIVNNIVIFLGIEKYFKDADNYWKNYSIQPNKTQQEAAGYSNVKEMQEVVINLHSTLKKTAAAYLKKGDRVLDVGCGPGLFLLDLEKEFDVTGIDLSPEMLKLAKQNIPNGTFYEGDFLSQQFNGKFSMIYFIGVLQYFSSNDLDKLFDKIYDLLEEDGIMMISYPHAISAADLSFPDINYICYSPALLNKKVSKRFDLIQNRHIVDNRNVDDYDKTPYKPTIPGVDKIYKNSSILIAKRRKN